MTEVAVIAKTSIGDPRDGGALRTAATVSALVGKRQVEIHFLPVRDEVTKTVDKRYRWAVLSAQIRVFLACLRTMSLSVMRWYSPSLVAQAVQVARRREVTAVLIEHSQLYVYSGLFSARTVVDFHNLEHELMLNYSQSARSFFRRLAARWEASRLRYLERRALCEADGVIFVSERDRQLAECILSGSRSMAPCVVATNGVSEDCFSIERHHPQDIVVFVANLGWRPNVDAALWLGERVWPLVRKSSSAELHLVGREPHPDVLALEVEPGVKVFGNVPSVLPHLASAKVATAPLLAAGGTRLKILEALACGVPVVATSLGALGLEDLENDDVLSINDDPAEFATAILEWLERDVDPDVPRNLVWDYRWSSAVGSVPEFVLSADIAPADNRER
ncbi:glycosyltransferase [Gordonia amicalis]